MSRFKISSRMISMYQIPKKDTPCWSLLSVKMTIHLPVVGRSGKDGRTSLCAAVTQLNHHLSKMSFQKIYMHKVSIAMRKDYFRRFFPSPRLPVVFLNRERPLCTCLFSEACSSSNGYFSDVSKLWDPNGPFFSGSRYTRHEVVYFRMVLKAKSRSQLLFHMQNSFC